MDDSLMSIESMDQFDDDDFIGQAMNISNVSNDSHTTSKIDVTDLISGPTVTQIPTILPKCRLDFDTPRNSTETTTKNRKRKNFSRRCLSSDLDNEPSENDQISFQEFRFAKEIKKSHDESISFFKSPSLFSSIENRQIKRTVKLELTPEFNTFSKDQKSSKDDNDITTKSNNGKNLSSKGGGIVFQKCFSENHASIMEAVKISSCDSKLIGDFSKTYALPLLANSKHGDLKSISCHVLADLLEKRYDDHIQSFVIVDCRFPYEFEGGHIKTAINLYNQEQILNHFMKKKSHDVTGTTSSSKQPTSSITSKRDILIFHCEFSSERGPSLCRFLRNKDRVKNSLVYPKLYYPEIYLLDGGYKEFFTHHPHLCDPCAYRPMHCENYEEDLRKFRSICKSFNLKYSTQKRNLRL